MSVRTMTRVWDLELPDSDKIVMLALADCANDEGHCWPSVASLVRKCSKSERTIQASIKRLVDEGILLRREVPGKGCNYTVFPKPSAVTAPRSAVTPVAGAPPQRTTQTPAAVADKPLNNHQSEAKASSQRVVDSWNVMAEEHGLPKVRVLDASRSQSLRLRLKEHGETVMLEAIQLVGRSPFLRGEGRDTKWRPDFDFLLKPASLRRILEGTYGEDEAKASEKWTPERRAAYHARLEEHGAQPVGTLAQKIMEGARPQ